MLCKTFAKITLCSVTIFMATDVIHLHAAAQVILRTKAIPTLPFLDIFYIRNNITCIFCIDLLVTVFWISKRGIDPICEWECL